MSEPRPQATWHGIPRDQVPWFPTVKGAKQKAPSYVTFEVTSEQQEDVGAFLGEVKALVHDAGLVYVGEQRL